MTSAAWFDLIAKALTGWLECLLHPIQTLNDVNHAKRETKVATRALKLWFFSTLIGTVTAWPVHRLYGISWNDTGFYVPSLFFADLSVLSGAATLHLFLKLHKQPSDFWRTTSTYIVTAAAYTPIVNLMDLPNVLARLAFEKLQLEKHVPPATAVERLFSPGVSHLATWAGPVANAADNISLMISAFYVVVFAEFLSAKEGRTRFSVYSALACSVISSCVLWILLLFPLEYINEYSSIRP